MEELEGSLSRIAEQLRARTEARTLRDLETDDAPSPFALGRISYNQFRQAMEMKQLLIEEFVDRPLNQVFEGESITNEYGSCFHLHEFRSGGLAINRRQDPRDALLAEFKLLYGIGPVVEQSLKTEGYRTLEDLTEHPRWGNEARELLHQIRRGDLRWLQRRIGRWLSLSHPLSLKLAEMLHSDDLCFFDLESMGLFQRPIILLGLAQPHESGFEIHQYLARNITEELSALVALTEHLNRAEALVSYNGRAFDVHYVEERLAYYGIYDAQRISRLPHFDLLHHARRTWDRLPNFRLETVESILLGVERTIDLPSALIPDFYNTYLEERNIGPLIPIIEHNRHDLISLAALFSRLCAEY
ncbi:MAG: ribonuclease H-like domain-containing protein [Candidatus Bipolaricaulia bacterium]